MSTCGWPSSLSLCAATAIALASCDSGRPASSGSVAPPCRVDGDCGDGKCNPATGACVACLQNAHCAAPTPVCDPASSTCVCEAAEVVEASCNDDVDNDCDGLTDCEDSDCDSVACGAYGRLCTAGTCLCPGNEGPEEVTCDDGNDNDCNGVADCIDSGCAMDRCGRGGRMCLGSVCICPGGQLAESSCGDDIDNDCDGDRDCADGDCDGASCAGGGTCVGGQCD